jgi:secondary thiamine-phosphate synthase enzyme
MEWIVMQSFSIETPAGESFLDITARVRECLRDAGIASGVCTVYVPHTTGGVTINENADPDAVRDMLWALGKFVPMGNGYHHREGNSPAHLKASLMGSSVTVPIEEGRMNLGTWQGIYLCEFDGPRHRRVLVQVLGR